MNERGVEIGLIIIYLVHIIILEKFAYLKVEYIVYVSIFYVGFIPDFLERGSDILAKKVFP